MSLHGVPKPGWRAFQLLHTHAGTRRVRTSVSNQTLAPPARDNKTFVSAFATSNGTVGSLRVFLGFWGNPEPPEGLVVRNRTVRVVVAHAAGQAPTAATAFVIDAEHANPQATWFAQGSPDVANATQREALLAASEVGVAAAGVQPLNATATAVTVEMSENSAVVVAFAT